MAKHLSARQVEEIVGILDGWPTGTKLTWDALIKRIAEEDADPADETNAGTAREYQGSAPDPKGKAA